MRAGIWHAGEAQMQDIYDEKDLEYDDYRRCKREFSVRLIIYIYLIPKLGHKQGYI